MLKKILLLLGLMFSLMLSAQDVSVKATMDSVNMLIGHQTKLTLEMVKPVGADIAFPIVLDTLVDKVEVLERTDIDTLAISTNRVQLTQEFTVTSFDSGFYYIPPFEFEIQESSGSGSIFTDPLVLKMFTYQIDTIHGIAPIKPVKKIPYKFKEFVPYIVGILIFDLILAILVILYLVYVKKRKIFVPAPKPAEAPYIVAFRDLERIREQKLWQKEKEKQYFTELTDTLRTYIEGRYEVDAMEQTSDEILADIKPYVEKDQYKELEEILKLSDLVKFAKMKPLMDESEKSFKTVYDFVDTTKFVFEESEEEDAPEESDNEQELAKE